MKGCKTIAEFGIKKWMEDNGFVMSEFDVKMNGTRQKYQTEPGTV